MAFLGMATGAVLTAGIALANPPNVKHIQYELFQNNIFSISFDIAWDAMKSLYKGSRYEKNPDLPKSNPLIGIGEFDLNGDKIPEIIAHPTEEYEEIGMFCKADSICPHYILEVRNKRVHTLGIIYASSIDRGDSIKNGYWELKAYSGDWKEPPTKDYELYVYDKKKDGYVVAVKPTPKKSR